MEVHAHSHTQRKKWYHYFWEFFMLFLAITLGFLVENLREHSVERHREKEYIYSLLKDLEYDTLQFSRIISTLKTKIPYFDSVLLFLDNPPAYNNRLSFDFYIKTNLENFYDPAEPTIQQLKSSGNLRLLENKLVLDSILIYDSHINGPYRNQTNYVIEFNKRLIQYTEKMFDPRNFNHFLNDVFNESDNNNPDYSLILYSKDKAQVQELYSLYVNVKATNVFYINHLQARRKEAERLLVFIKKEYHLE